MNKKSVIAKAIEDATQEAINTFKLQVYMPMELADSIKMLALKRRTSSSAIVTDVMTCYMEGLG